MDKRIEDYLHLYLGCEVMYKGEIHFLCGVSKPYKTNDKTIATFSVRPNNKGFRSTIYSLSNFNDIKIILRPLSDMTEDEAIECIDYDPKIFIPFNEISKDWRTKVLDADRWRKLISKGFDLFGLIDAGLAIDKTKL